MSRQQSRVFDFQYENIGLTDLRPGRKASRPDDLLSQLVQRMIGQGEHEIVSIPRRVRRQDDPRPVEGGSSNSVLVSDIGFLEQKHKALVAGDKPASAVTRGRAHGESRGADDQNRRHLSQAPEAELPQGLINRGRVARIDGNCGGIDFVENARNGSSREQHNHDADDCYFYFCPCHNFQCSFDEG